jgi:hypothetical protein
MIKEPPHFGNDKPWMVQLKDWCRTVKQEFERTALRGDGVTTSIRSGVISALHDSDYPQWQISQEKDGDEISVNVSAGYINWGGNDVETFAESFVDELEGTGTSFDVATLADGSYSVVWFTESQIANVGEVRLVTDDEISSNITWLDYHVLALLVVDSDDDDKKTVVVTQKQTDEIIVNVSKTKSFIIVNANSGLSYSENLDCYPYVNGATVTEDETVDVLKIHSLQELDTSLYKYEEADNSIRRSLTDEDKAWWLNPEQYYTGEIILAVYSEGIWYDLNVLGRFWERYPVDEIPEFDEPIDEPCEHPFDPEIGGGGGGDDGGDEPESPWGGDPVDPEHPLDNPCA